MSDEFCSMFWPVGEYPFLVGIEDKRDVGMRQDPDEKTFDRHSPMRVPKTDNQVIEISISNHIVS